MKFWKRTTCAVLMALVLTLSGCGSQATWVYRTSESQPPVGVYLIYMLNASATAEEKVKEEHEGEEGFEITDYDSLLKQTVEGVSVSQWMTDEADSLMRQYFATESRCAQLGISLSEEEIASAQTSAASEYDSYGAFYEEVGIAQSSLQMQVENSLKKDKLFDAIYGEGGEKEISQQELRDFFNEEFLKIEFMLFTKAIQDEMDEAGEVVKTMEELDAESTKRAEAYMKRLEAGEELEELVFEQEKEDAEASGGDVASVTKPEPGARSMVLADFMKGSYYSDELIDGAKAMSVGDYSIVEDDYYLYVLHRIDVSDDTTSFESYKSSLPSLMKSDEFAEVLKEWGTQLEVETNTSALSRYKPSWLKSGTSSSTAAPQ